MSKKPDVELATYATNNLGKAGPNWAEILAEWEQLQNILLSIVI